MLLKQESIEMPYIPQYNKGSKFVRFGKNNSFPDELITLIERSPVQSVVISKMIDYTYGLGLSDYEGTEPNVIDRWDDLLKKIITDYITFGAFSLQIIKISDKFMFFHQPVNEVRMEPLDDRNNCPGYYISTKWNKGASISQAVHIDAFGLENPVDGKPYLIYYKEYNPTEYYYAVPKWFSAANWIAADAALSRYYKNYINNNMSANFAITYPIEPDESKKQYIYDSVSESFGGEENAGSILLLFGENGVKPEISNITASNADLYNTVEDIVKRNILTANNVSSPTLFGISTTTGFSSAADELIAAYTLYKNTVIIHIRNFVLSKVNRLRSLNGDGELTLLDINVINELEGLTQNNTEKINEANSI